MSEAREVTVACRTCGPVVLATRDVRAARSQTSPDEGLFAFTCPRCGRDVLQDAPATTVALLFASGARPLSGLVPFELAEQHAGPPITWDELLDAHEQMSTHCCPQDELVR